MSLILFMLWHLCIKYMGFWMRYFTDILFDKASDYLYSELIMHMCLIGRSNCNILVIRFTLTT